MNKLSAIKITGLLGHHEFESTIHPAMLITGPNESGKSTILKSIQYALTGEMTGTGKRNQDIFKGCHGSGFEVQLTMGETTDEGQIITRLIKRGMERKGAGIKEILDIKPLPANQLKPETYLEMNYKVLPLVWDFSNFSNLSDEQMRQYILSLVGHAAITKGFDLKDCVPTETIIPGLDPISQLQSSLEFCNKKVLETRKEIKELQAIMKSAAGEYNLNDRQYQDLEKREFELSNFRQQLKNLINISEQKLRYEQVKLELKALRGTFDKDAKLKQIQEMSREIQKNFFDPRLIVRLQGEYDRLKGEHSLHEMWQNIDLNSIQAGTACILCDRKLTEETVAKINSRVFEILLTGKQVFDQMEELRNQIQQLEAERHRANTINEIKTAEIGKLKAEIEQWEQGFHPLKKQIEKAETEIKKLACYKDVNLESQKTNCEAIAKQIEKLEADLGPALRANEHMKVIREKEIDLQAAKETENEYGSYVKSIKQKIAQILDDKIAPITGFVNEVLETILPGRKFFISTWDQEAEKIQFQYGLDGVHFDSLSQSTRDLLGMAFIAAHYKFNQYPLEIIILDELGHFDQNRLTAILNAGVKLVRDGITHFIAAGNISLPPQIDDIYILNLGQ